MLKIGDKVQVKISTELSGIDGNENYDIFKHIGRIESITEVDDDGERKTLIILDNLKQYYEFAFYPDELIRLKKSKIKLPSWF
jgi:hypothetical protein